MRALKGRASDLSKILSQQAEAVAERVRLSASQPSNLISFAVGAAACFILTGLYALHYGQPLGLRGDHLNLLAVVKNFIEGGGDRYVHALGFPGMRDNLFFPMFDTSYLTLLWSLTWFTHNPFRVVSRTPP